MQLICSNKNGYRPRDQINSCTSFFCVLPSHHRHHHFFHSC
ncbi:hypothetical protein [Candidatus Protochlamydia phocaeensis]|nr:hypothetical protein [Candidatus Protochlamydia phocaeensis]